MLVMGTNTWERDTPKELLIMQALKFSDGLKSQGVAELQGAWIANDKKMLWCCWETEDLEGLKAAFDQMNKQSGLKSELYVVEDMRKR